MTEIPLRDGPSGPVAGPASVVRSTLADLVARDSAAFPSGTRAWVVSENKFYQLDTSAPLTAFSPLIIARPTQSQTVNGSARPPAALSGAWYRESRQYVVGNFTLWACPFGGAFGTGDNKLGGFTPGQLLASGAVKPDIVLDLSGDWPLATSAIADVVTDALGNLWVTGLTNFAFTTGAVKKYLLKDVLASGSPTASVSLPTAPPIADFVNDTFACFDKQNALWVAMPGHNTFGIAALQKYNQRSYSRTATTANPDLTISLLGGTSVAISTSNASGMAFDVEGNLWMSIGFTNNGANSGGLVMLAASQLNASSSALVPAVIWSGANFIGASTDNVGGIAFGPTGLLWTTGAFGANRVAAFDPRNPVSGNQAPTIILTSSLFNVPTSVAFDSSGNLWVSNFNDGKLLRIPAAQLGASGAVVPDIVLSPVAGQLAFLDTITFPNNPDRSGLLASGVPLTQ